MKKIFSVLISLCLIISILGDCFKKNASSVSECEKHKKGSTYCCLVEYRTNKNAEYKKACVPIIKEDIEDGKFEETIGVIELGNYTKSNWTSEIMNLFTDYSSISNFDCKGNYISEIMMIVPLIFIIFLI